MRDHAADIRALRKQSNAAIAALDPDYVVGFMAHDVRVEVAGGGTLVGRLANREAFAEQMESPGFGGYVRTPTQVLVQTDPLRATERGTWTGRWQVKGRTQQQQGTYTAEWRFGEMGWEIVAEQYGG
jgi:ketosteroid isomerase-like protein